MRLWTAIVLLFLAMAAFEFYYPERTLGHKITNNIEQLKAKREEQLKSIK